MTMTPLGKLLNIWALLWAAVLLAITALVLVWSHRPALRREGHQPHDPCYGRRSRLGGDHSASQGELDSMRGQAVKVSNEQVQQMRDWYRDRHEEQLGLLKAYETLADQFIAKVDSGVARSSETYATFKSLRERS